MVKTKEQELAEKYGKQSPEEMVKEQANLEQEVIVASKAMEQEIENFSTKIDDMINPKTNNVMARIKRPTSAQWKLLVPPEFAKFKDSPQDIPLELAQTYENIVYSMMELLIVQPVHTEKWWRENTDYSFVAAFQKHLTNIFNEMSTNLENF